MELLFCIIGLIMLIAAPVLCWFCFESPFIWLGSLIIGELFALIGALPIILELLCK